MAESIRPGGNGYKPDQVKGFVDRIENLYGEIDSEKGAYMRRVKTIRESMTMVYEEASALGVPKKALKSVVKARAFERKAEAVRDDLKGEEQDNYDLIRQALGDLADLPLGEAALQRSAASLP